MKIKTKFHVNGKIIESEIETSITKEEFEEYGKLFCDCGYLKEHEDEESIYVENYEGVIHGTICPNCKKFIQIR